MAALQYSSEAMRIVFLQVTGEVHVSRDIFNPKILTAHSLL